MDGYAGTDYRLIDYLDALSRCVVKMAVREARQEERVAKQLVKPKGAKSMLWNHFGFEIDDSGEFLNKKFVCCKLCEKLVAYSGNTTNLKQHLQLHHRDALSDPGPSSSKQVTLGDVGLKPTAKLPSGGKRAQQITESLARFIAMDMRPVSIIEGRGFRN